LQGRYSLVTCGKTPSFYFKQNVVPAVWFFFPMSFGHRRPHHPTPPLSPLLLPDRQVSFFFSFPSPIVTKIVFLFYPSLHLLEGPIPFSLGSSPSPPRPYSTPFYWAFFPVYLWSLVRSHADSKTHGTPLGSLYFKIEFLPACQPFCQQPSG